MRIWKTICVTAAFCLTTTGVGAAELSFGIVPQQSATELARLWTPVIRYLSERTGIKLAFATAKDIPTFEERLAQGAYDLAYMNPYHYTVYSAAPGYRVFAKEKDRSLVGILVVRADSPHRSIEDLRGTEIAFPAPAAFAATLLPRAHLRRAGIGVRATFVASHDSVYLAVARKLYAAGGGIVRTFNTLPAPLRKDLRILWQTPPSTPHAFAAHPRIEPDTVARLEAAMRAMGDDPTGKALLEPLAMKGFVRAQDADYAEARALDLGAFLPKKSP